MLGIWRNGALLTRPAVATLSGSVAVPEWHRDVCIRPIHVHALNLAGHNKWSKVKGPKMAADLAKSKQINKLIRDIKQTMKEGGVDPKVNSRLARLLEKSRAMNVPKTTIESTLKKSSTQENCERYLFEARGPGGYSIIIEYFTSSRARTMPELRRIINKLGGVSKESGSQLFMFDQKASITLSLDALPHADPMEYALTKDGVEDVEEYTDDDDGTKYCVLLCNPKSYQSVLDSIQSEGIEVHESIMEYLPKKTVQLNDADYANAERLTKMLLEDPDVENVYVTYEQREDSVP